MTPTLKHQEEERNKRAKTKTSEGFKTSVLRKILIKCDKYCQQVGMRALK